jgi:hypothetical protein
MPTSSICEARINFGWSFVNTILYIYEIRDLGLDMHLLGVLDFLKCITQILVFCN